MLAVLYSAQNTHLFHKLHEYDRLFNKYIVSDY